ncbi:MAG: CYTH domain-containing protein [Lentisphaeria bacterium]|jgi:adenylate cyclase|nr:CYTH domain-containing protein [Lentisphaeria bacterium]
MIETELKFLPKNDGWRSQATRHVTIKQGYFTRAEGYNVRVRIIDNKSAKLTIKSKKLESGISRYEFEYPIPLEDAETMMAEFCGGRIVEKTRHYVNFAGHCWEVDEFFGANEGLVVAEIELQKEHETFEKPDWIGEDVTADNRYGNQNLADKPFREWKSK